MRLRKLYSRTGTTATLSAMMIMAANTLAIATADETELAHYAFEGNLVNLVSREELLEVFGNISFSMTTASPGMDGRPGSIRLETENDQISIVTDELPVHKNDVLELRAVVRIDTRSKDRPDLPIVSLHEVLGRHQPLVLLSHHQPSFLRYINRRQWHELTIQFYRRSILIKLDERVLDTVTRPPLSPGVILEHEIVFSNLFGYIDDLSLVYHKNSAPHGQTNALAIAQQQTNTDTTTDTTNVNITPIAPDTRDVAPVAKSDDADHNVDRPALVPADKPEIVATTDNNGRSEDQENTRYVKISIAKSANNAVGFDDDMGYFESHVVIEPRDRVQTAPDLLEGAKPAYDNKTENGNNPAVAKASTRPDDNSHLDLAKASQPDQVTTDSEELIHEEPAHIDIVLIGDAPDTSMQSDQSTTPSGEPYDPAQQPTYENDTLAVALPSPTPASVVSHDGRIIDPRAPYLNRHKKLPDSYHEGGQAGTIYIDNDLSNSIVAASDETSAPVEKSYDPAAIQTQPRQNSQRTLDSSAEYSPTVENKPNDPLDAPSPAVVQTIEPPQSTQNSIESNAVDASESAQNAFVSDSSQPGIPRLTVERTIEDYQLSNIDLETDFTVVSWFQLDQDSYDTRYNASPGTLHGQAFLDDSFFLRPDGQPKTAIRFNQFGDAISSQVSARSVLRPSGTNTISIEAMVFAEQWSLNGDTATRLLGLVSQPGIELSLVSEGDFLSVQAGLSRSQNNQTIKGALKTGTWHHVKLTLAMDTWELRVNGESLLTGRVPGDGLEYWSSDYPISILAGGYRGWLDDLVVRSSFGKSLLTLP